MACVAMHMFLEFAAYFQLLTRRLMKRPRLLNMRICSVLALTTCPNVHQKSATLSDNPWSAPDFFIKPHMHVQLISCHLILQTK